MSRIGMVVVALAIMIALFAIMEVSSGLTWVLALLGVIATLALAVLFSARK